MIPSLVQTASAGVSVLPPGIHSASLREVVMVFASNRRRRELYAGLVEALRRLRRAGCLTVYLDGSYVTNKHFPEDYDACWEPYGVDYTKLDPLFLQFDSGRRAQKVEFKGEFFPSTMICEDVGETFLDFFQIEPFTMTKKGIISIALPTEPLLIGEEYS